MTLLTDAVKCCSYPRCKNLYHNITYMYPKSNIWLTGHSLGGALASLLGASFGAPAVAFESPGDKQASTRLHLPQPVSQSCSFARAPSHTITPTTTPYSPPHKSISRMSIILLIPQPWVHVMESYLLAQLQAMHWRLGTQVVRSRKLSHRLSVFQVSYRPFNSIRYGHEPLLVRQHSPTRNCQRD